MPYDLYGNHYASERDAMNAELAQCAEIDSRHAQARADKMEQKAYYESAQINERLNYLEQRIEQLEKLLSEKK